MKSPFTQLLVRWLVLALGVMLATRIVPGIKCDNGGTLIAVVLVLSFCNAILKPLLVLFTLPFILLTLGLGVLVINALLFLFVGYVVEGFVVNGFWSAFGGALVVSITNWAVSGFTGEPKKDKRKPPERKPKDDDVIDI
jgi:putative membrane protein